MTRNQINDYLINFLPKPVGAALACPKLNPVLAAGLLNRPPPAGCAVPNPVGFCPNKPPCKKNRKQMLASDNIINLRQ